MGKSIGLVGLAAFVSLSFGSLSFAMPLDNLAYENANFALTGSGKAKGDRPAQRQRLPPCLPGQKSSFDKPCRGK
jgi:hypothetical protein